MRTLLLIIIAGCVIWSCSNSSEQGSAQGTETDSTQIAEDPRMARKTASVQDREPEIEMVNINWVAVGDTSRALYKAWIQNKDAKYYLTDGVQGDQLTLELTGGHPAIQLIIISPEEEEVFRQNLGEEPIEWQTSYNETGRYTMIVQIDSKYEGKEQLKTYFELKMRLF